MRVLLDTTYGRRGHTGTGVYLQGLVPALRDLDVEVIEVADERRGAPGGGPISSVRNLAEDLRWVSFELPRLARRYEVDVIHHALPAHASGAEVPQVITVHDLAVEARPQDFPWAFRTWTTRAHRAAAVRAHAVVAVSAATAREAMQRWTLDPDKLIVAPHGPGQRLDPVPRRPEPRHVLYVGDDEPRKDVDVLARAAPRLPLPVVLAGRATREGLEAVASPDAITLAALYADAAVLVHPSRLEGFGLTVLEALCAGVPVAAARTAAVQEVAGDAATYFEPGDADGLVRAVHEALARADELVARGAERAAEFTWERSARAHRDAYALAVRGDAVASR